MRVKLTIEYDGTNYSGWQVQDRQDSVQGQLERALERLYGYKIRLSAAGRTDAGVHALGQVAAFTAPARFGLDELRRALNALTPPDIVVLEVAEVAQNFDPRRHARSRLYKYRILNRALPSAFYERYCWRIAQPLDISAMNSAAGRFVGEHDFAAFRVLGSPTRTTVRRILESRWVQEGPFLTYWVEGVSFLRHMVRTMVGLMVEIGCGKLSPEVVDELLASRDRSKLPAAAPARGLFLAEVRY